MSAPGYLNGGLQFLRKITLLILFPPHPFLSMQKFGPQIHIQTSDRRNGSISKINPFLCTRWPHTGKSLHHLASGWFESTPKCLSDINSSFLQSPSWFTACVWIKQSHAITLPTALWKVLTYCAPGPQVTDLVSVLSPTQRPLSPRCQQHLPSLC